MKESTKIWTKKFFDKILDKSVFVYYISIRQRMNNHLTISGPGFSDCLLHSLSSGLWAQTEFWVPISFSPFLPFRVPEKNRPIGRLFLFFKNSKYFPMRTAYKLIDRYSNCHFISTPFQYFFVANKCHWITRNINHTLYF